MTENPQEFYSNPEKTPPLIPAVIIENDSDIIHILKDWLEDSDFTTVGVAKNRKEADKLVDQLKDLGNPVVFLDGNLSDEKDEDGNRWTYADGKELSKKITDTDPGVNIIIVGISRNNEPLKHMINFEINKSLLRGTADIPEFNKIREGWSRLQERAQG